MQRACQSSPAIRTRPSGRHGVTAVARIPTSDSTPTAGRLRRDRRHQNHASPSSRRAPAATTTMPQGAGTTRIARTMAAMRAMEGRYAVRAEREAPPRLRNVIDELEIDHLGRVALARTDPYDPRVTAGTVGEARGHLREEMVNHLVRAEVGERLPACVQIAPPTGRDHLLGNRLDGLR